MASAPVVVVVPFSVLFFALSLYFCDVSASVLKGKGDLIQQTCKQIDNYKLCVSLLQSDPHTALKTNLNGLLHIFINIAIKKATSNKFTLGLGNISMLSFWKEEEQQNQEKLETDFRNQTLELESCIGNEKTLRVIAITVEEEDDIRKFKDYTPSTSGYADEVKGSSDSAPPKKEALEPVSQPEQKIAKPTEAPPAKDRIFASPLAKSLAEEHSVPLSNIRGTGPDGSIVKADIEDYLASSKKGVPTPVSKAKDTTIAGDLDYSDIPHSQIRKLNITASRLLLSKQTIPYYYLSVDTCVDKLMDLRSQLNSLQEASGGKRISINDLVIKEAALALRKVPQCNSSWTNDYMDQNPLYHNVNINVAVQTDNGLFVPVIRDADKKGLSKISDEVQQLAQKAKDNSLKPDDYEGGTFTLSNLGGPFGIKQFCAIINPPQSGILAVGSAEKRVIPGSDPDELDFTSFMMVTLSCDHSVIDGAIGAEWLKAFKGYIENPESMLL
ncbi:dihydrolipoyllysine-residue acetyltransferase component 3 of pyruvate dehydrogenase complex, mitochondrial-like [Macadamia integrifolia]|uniref:dihydrolipoyllysine-residue acetyltransferase component 3 of pyruvate dehydrogenase complex, mitochondrial-like n=1 Tax=Macadamia integrifolia TaxID=60698 RepID=UPI001C4FF449|nr:dihydrolipoyllysine-residue acetyltransferase component 3 of pyruvate dehydrogenase complex, mitochondrial-like [Macadamia integrifolia]